MRVHPRESSGHRDDSGAAAVEFALVVIPLLMVIAGIVNLGIVFAQQLALDNAVRQSARAGVVDTGANLTTVARNEFDNTIARSKAGTVAVTFPLRASCEDSDFGDSLEVRGSVTSTFLFPWPAPSAVIPNQVTLRSEAEFQCEFS